MILGADLHAGYGRIDFGRAAAAGVRFVICKCSQGNDGRDSRFDEYVFGAKMAGLYVGGYHFAYPLPPGKPGREPREQAAIAYAAAKGLGQSPGELPPALDLEWPPPNEWAKWGVDGKYVANWGREYCEEATRLWGRRPMLYSYPWFWAALDATADVAWAAEYPLWMANYTHTKAWLPPEGARPVVPEPWTDWMVWQFSADGSPMAIPGIPACPVDRDCFNGDLTALRKLANIDPEADTQPELPDAAPDSEPESPVIHNSADLVAEAVREYQQRRDGERGEE